MKKELTIGEIAKVESITGTRFDDEDQPRGKYLAAFVFVVMKRSNPEFTLDMAYDMPNNMAGEVLAPFFEDTDPNS